jgi:uncharacterized protein (DUF302 family)
MEFPKPAVAARESSPRSLPEDTMSAQSFKGFQSESVKPMRYGFSRSVSLSYERAIERVTEELQKEGFGVLTTIDVKETLKKKLGVEFNKYVILGACNPPFAHKALLAEEQIGLLLPCNVIVYEKDGKTIVAAFDPMAMTAMVESEALKSIAEEVNMKLSRAINAIE